MTLILIVQGIHRNAYFIIQNKLLFRSELNNRLRFQISSKLHIQRFTEATMKIVHQIKIFDNYIIIQKSKQSIFI